MLKGCRWWFWRGSRECFWKSEGIQEASGMQGQTPGCRGDVLGSQGRCDRDGRGEASAPPEAEDPSEGAEGINGAALGWVWGCCGDPGISRHRFLGGLWSF